MLGKRRAHLERARLRALAGPASVPVDADADVVRERAQDLLRPDTIGGYLASGLDLYLDEASREPDADIGERISRVDVPSIGFEGAVEEEADPVRRIERLRDWAHLERALEPSRAARGSARADAARAAGAVSVAALRERVLGVDLASLVAEAERAAIAPLDAAIARAAAADPGPLPQAPAPLPLLRRLGAALGDDPDVRGARLLAAAAPCWRAVAVVPPGDRGAVVIGTRGGILGWLDALDAFGVATRGSVVARAHDCERIAREHPAFRHAAAALFRRLPLEPAFRAWCGARDAEAGDRFLRLAAALAPRVAWASASAALARDPVAEAPDRHARACGRPALPSVRAAAWDADPALAAGWLGEIWAVLLEERLRTRWGRRWFEQPSAGSWLRDVWTAETDSTPASMAAQAGLGTMAPDVILESCRPARRDS